VSLPIDQLEASVLNLPRTERARLAHRLIESLDDLSEEEPAEIARAWDEEIARRVAELDSGEAELIPAEEVFAKLRSRLKE
jgi:putative addiction module component (TIGR02574 family)